MFVCGSTYLSRLSSSFSSSFVIMAHSTLLFGLYNYMPFHGILPFSIAYFFRVFSFFALSHHCYLNTCTSIRISILVSLLGLCYLLIMRRSLWFLFRYTIGGCVNQRGTTAHRRSLFLPFNIYGRHRERFLLSSACRSCAHCKQRR